MQHPVVIIALRYFEPEYAQTEACIKKFNVPVIWADRDGVGNLSRAFNEAFLYQLMNDENFSPLPRYVWFVTNIQCDENLLSALVKAMDETNYAALHPAFQSSHSHHRPDGSNDIKEVPFVEFTAPIFRADIFEEYYLDENLWYWYMDIDICLRMQADGHRFGVHHGVTLQHEYLNGEAHFFSTIRSYMRAALKPVGVSRMNTKYGNEWKKLLSS